VKQCGRMCTLAIGAVVLVAGAAAYFAPQAWGLWQFSQALDAEAAHVQKVGAAAYHLAEVCGNCHGIGNENRSDFYPTLAGQPVGYIERQLNAYASGTRGHPMMQPLALSLSPEERNTLDNYYSAVPRVYREASAPPAGDAQRDLVKGKELTASCSACHGNELTGGKLPGSEVTTPLLAGQSHDYVVSQLKAFRDGRRIDATGSMQAIARGMSDADMLAVARFLASH
jgi:cytochrome c553